MPHFTQLFLTARRPKPEHSDPLHIERSAFCVRKRAEHELVEDDVYFPSLSSRTIVYKGMLTEPQVERFFADLTDERVTSAIGLVHSRFSTNTFPSWPLAHPYRYVAHNGEINTLRGNRNWMDAREALLETDLIPGDLKRVYPVITRGASDSASFDEVLELLHLGGRSVTDVGLVPLAAEVGVLDIDPATIVRKGRLEPGRMFLVDTAEGLIIEDEEVKTELATAHPYDEWVEAGLVHLEDLPERDREVPLHAALVRRQQAFGYTEEALEAILAPMARPGAEPIGSMGNDSPIATLSS